MQAPLQSSLGNSAMSDVSTADVVSFQTSDRSILSNVESAVSGRVDANSFTEQEVMKPFFRASRSRVKSHSPYNSQNDPG